MSSSDENPASSTRRGPNRFRSMRTTPASNKPTSSIRKPGNSLTNPSLRSQPSSALRNLPSGMSRKPEPDNLINFDEEPGPNTNSSQQNIEPSEQIQTQPGTKLKVKTEDLLPLITPTSSTSPLASEQVRQLTEAEEKQKRREEKEARRAAKAERHAARERERQRLAALAAEQQNQSHDNNSERGSIHSGNHQILDSQSKPTMSDRNLSNEIDSSQMIDDTTSMTSASRQIKSSNKKTEKLQARIIDLDTDLKERGEQILKLRKENRALQAKLDEANDAIGIEKQSHEKILNDIQNRSKRQIDAAQREIKHELDEANDTISNLNEQIRVLSKEAKTSTANAQKYKQEMEKINERFNTTSAQLVDMSQQCQKLTDAAVEREKENKDKIDEHRQNNVQSEEMMQNYQKQIYELQLELEQAKNDTRGSGC